MGRHPGLVKMVGVEERAVCKKVALMTIVCLVKMISSAVDLLIQIVGSCSSLSNPC